MSITVNRHGERKQHEKEWLRYFIISQDDDQKPHWCGYALKRTESNPVYVSKSDAKDFNILYMFHGKQSKYKMSLSSSLKGTGEVKIKTQPHIRQPKAYK